MSALYRVQQFVRAAGAWAQPQAPGEAQLYLPTRALALFQAMPRYDRQHSLRVLRTLRAGGQTDPDLMAAALLHDVGKTAQGAGSSRLGHRVVSVLLRAFWPGMLARLGQERPGGWRRPFFVQQHHAAFGAELALQAGCSPRTAELIRCHEEPAAPTDDPLLTALQSADNIN
jgi:hypothetical protein